jgi:ABC-type nitrate/sulfonate/bicarbonate transport system permease component
MNEDRGMLRRFARAVGPPAILLALLLLAWEAWVRLTNVDPSVVAPPSRVAGALTGNAGTLVHHAATTLGETAVGLAIGAALGVAVGILIAAVPLARRAIEPLLVTLQTVPPIVLAPILVLALGFGWAPRIVVVVLIVFFPVAIAATGAFLTADTDRVELIRSFGGTEVEVFRRVRLPGAAPAIFDGLRIAAAYSVAGAAIAEQIGGARSGLGLFIARSQRSFRADQVIAGVVVIAVLSLIVYAAVSVIARRATPWRSAARGGPS